jgi:hypothetical protein
VSDSHEPLGQDMQKEAANEFDTLQGHDFPPVAVAIVAPVERDGLLVHLHQAMVGEGDSVSVAGQIIEDLFRTGEGRLAIDHPFLFPALRQESLERLGV